MTDVNSLSIGIELDNDGFEPFPDVQIDALLRLLGDIRQRQRIPIANFVGHADVAPLRKDDPSELFPWRTLAEQGFGLWCEPPSEVAGNGANALSQEGDLGLLLAALGYDPRALEASRKAFRLHYMRGRVKLALGLAKGKKQHDKRDAERERDWTREKGRLMRERRRTS